MTRMETETSPSEEAWERLLAGQEQSGDDKIL